MSTVAAPFGLRPVASRVGFVRPSCLENGIASGYASNIMTGDPVVIDTATGKLTLAAAGAGQTIDGVFAGVFYTDGSGREVNSPYWPANTVATNIRAFLFRNDPGVEFEVQADGAIAQSAIGDESVIALAAGNTRTGQSSAALSASGLVGAGGQGAVKITGISKRADNTAGDAYTVVRCILAKPGAFGPGTAA